jgi:hypothetical protein
MTLPPARLTRLYLDSRQTRTTLLLIAVTAGVLRASQPLTKNPGVFAQLTLLLLTLGTAAVIAAATRNPFGEAEHTASIPLPALRLAHLAAMTAAATAVTAAAGLTGSYGISATEILRNLAGFTGIALLTAAIAGAHLAWTVPLAYVMYCGAELDAQTPSPWSWPILPVSNHTATFTALCLLTAGITTATITGARERHGG